MSKKWTSTLLALALSLLAGCATTSGGDHERFDQALELLRQDRHADAAALLEPLAEAEPELTGVQLNLAIAYLELNQDEQAREALEAALASEPDHPEALNLMAIQERRAGRFERARELYLRLLSAHPEHDNGNLNLAILCDIYLHDLECAEDYYQRYLALSRDEDKEVVAWVADLERRLPGGKE